MEKPRILQDTPFTELVGLKSLTIGKQGQENIVHHVDMELRHRYADFRDYLDRYDNLTPEQKCIAGSCISYRMALGAVNRVVANPSDIRF